MFNVGLGAVKSIAGEIAATALNLIFGFAIAKSFCSINEDETAAAVQA